MVQSNGVEVCVRRFEDKTPYREYAAPTASPKYSGHPNEVYIEAIDEERFEIFTNISPEFSFMDAPHIKIKVQLEDNVASRSYRAKDASIAGNVIPLAKKPSYTRTMVKKMKDGEWKNCAFAFSRLSIGMSAPTLVASIRTDIPR